MGIRITWDEFIKRTDPQGKAGMTAKKFQGMIIGMIFQAAKKAQPPKAENKSKR